VTVVPAFTVRVPGVNVKLTMFIVLLAAAVVVLVGAGVVVLDVEQPIPPIISTAVRIAMIVNTRYFFILSPFQIISLC
jgi:hypothetical protein